MDTKFCSKCGIEKPATVEWFSKQKTGRGGLRAYCKVCLSGIGRKYYMNRKDYYKITSKIYRDDNKDRRNVLLQKYLTRKQNLPSTLTFKQWESTKEHFNQRCAYCGKKLSNPEQDHIIPLAKGGGHTKGNILPSCKPCNNSKFTRDLKFWYPTQKHFSIERYNKILAFIKQHKSIHDYTPITGSEDKCKTTTT